MNSILSIQRFFSRQPAETRAKLPSQKPADWRRMLAAVPERNRAAETKWLDDNALQLTVHKRKPAFLLPPLSWVFRPRLHRSYILDRLGASVLKMCDGRQSVEAIIDRFAQNHNLTFHEARVAVTGYLQGLVKRGAVVMLMENSEAEL